MRCKKTFLIVGLIILPLVSGAGVWGVYRFQSAQWVIFRSESPVFTLSYHRAMALETPTDDNQRDHIRTALKLSEGTLARPFTINLRIENGLRIVASLTKQETLPMLMSNADRIFPQKFLGYHKISEETFDYLGKKSGQFYFTYTGPSGETIKQRFWMIVYDGDTAFHISAQAREADFDSLNKKYFDRVFASLQFE